MTFPVVGMIGGGQLARMAHQAGIPLGIRFRLLADGPQDSAALVVNDVVVGDYRDLETLRSFARGCDVVTFDHEHVPTDHLRALQAEGIAVRPGPDALINAQDKGVMRARLKAAGIPCPRHRIVADPADVAAEEGLVHPHARVVIDRAEVEEDAILAPLQAELALVPAAIMETRIGDAAALAFRREGDFDRVGPRENFFRSIPESVVVEGEPPCPV